MGVEEEVWRIRAEVVGLQSIKNLEDQLATNAKGIDALRQSFKQGKTVEAEFIQETLKLVAAQKALEQQLKFTKAQFDAQGNLTATIQSVGNAATAAKTKMSPWVQSIQAMSYALQDATTAGGDFGQKMMSTLNNIPMMLAPLSAMGARAQQAAIGISLMATAAHVFYTNWNEVLKLFGIEPNPIIDQLEAIKAKMQEIEKKPFKFAVDVQQLAEAQSQIDAIKTALGEVDKLKKGRGYYEKESGAAIEGMFAEATDEQGKPIKGATIEAQLRAQMAKELMGASGPLQQARKEAREAARAQKAAEEDLSKATDLPTITMAKIDIFRSRRAKEAAEEKAAGIETGITGPGGKAEAAIGDILAKAKTGAGQEQRTAQEKLAARLRQLGYDPLARGVMAAAPERIQEQEEQEAAVDKSVEKATRLGIKRRAIEAKSNAIRNEQDNEQIRLREERLQRLRDKEGPPLKIPLGPIQPGRPRSLMEQRADRIRRYQEREQDKKMHKEFLKDQRRDRMLAPAEARILTHPETMGPILPMMHRRIPIRKLHPKEKGRPGLHPAAQGPLKKPGGQAAVQLQKQGVATNGATLTAMGQGLQAMQAMSAAMQKQMIAANQMGRGFKQVAQQSQGGPTGLPMGYA